MREVIAMHGWSGSSSNWEEWMKLFQMKGWLWQSGERGYGVHKPSTPFWSPKKDQKNNMLQYRAVIAHSLGAHLIKKEVLAEANSIILLSSFGRFIPEDIDQRALKAGLFGMKKSLVTNKEKNMIKNFLQKACFPNPINLLPYNPIIENLTQEGRKRLLNDLDLLVKTSGLPSGFPKDARVLVIDSQEDAIVHPKARAALIENLNQHLTNPISHWRITNAGHALLAPNLKENVFQWLESCI